jgi:hypothetical protein
VVKLEENTPYKDSNINNDLIFLLAEVCRMTAARIPRTYKMVSRRTKIPVRTLCRYVNDPRYCLIAFGAKFGYQVVIRKHKKYGNIFDVVKRDINAARNILDVDNDTFAQPSFSPRPASEDPTDKQYVPPKIKKAGKK